MAKIFKESRMTKRKTPTFDLDTVTMDRIANEILMGEYENESDTAEESAFRRSVKGTTIRYAMAFGYASLPAELPDISDVVERPFSPENLKRLRELKE